MIDVKSAGNAASETFRMRLAGGDVLDEAHAVADEGVRRMLLTWAAGSLAEKAAAVHNRMQRDLGRLREISEEGEGVPPASCGEDVPPTQEGEPLASVGDGGGGLLACMLEALMDDAATYREAMLLRAEAYRSMGEAGAARVVMEEHARFARSFFAGNIDVLERFSLRVRGESVNWLVLVGGGADVSADAK